MNDQDQSYTTSETQYQKTHFSRRGAGWGIVLLLALMLPAAMIMTAFTPEEDVHSAQIRHWMGEEDTGNPIDGIMDIDVAWEIEDTRSESDATLIERFYQSGAMMGFDRENMTFYCSLGMENGDEWPEMAFSAVGPQDLRVAWIDDYTYDWCSDAIAEGYRYELLAYTDTAYQYVGVVFTGLPIVVLEEENGEEITWEATNADFHLSGEEPLYARVEVNRRGGGLDRSIDKKSYHIEFRAPDAKGKFRQIERSVLGMPADTDWLLVGSPGDDTAVRNQLGWEVWKEWNGGEGVTMLKSRLVELFVGGRYAGIYQLMQRINADDELTKMGGSLRTDMAARLVTSINKGDRPRMSVYSASGYVYDLELRQYPQTMRPEDVFAVYAPYFSADAQSPETLDDEAFEEVILRHFDVRQLMDYFLYIQSMSLDIDNVNNNVYIWARLGEDGVYHYTLTPWDVDNAFKLLDLDHDGQMNEINYHMEMFNRMLDLNVGDCRRIIREIWAEKRSGVISDDAIYQRISDMEAYINASGAYLRESQRYYGEAYALDLTQMCALAVGHQSTVESSIDGFWPLEE